MPPKGKCESCCKEAFLYPLIVRHKQDGHIEVWAVCERCRRYYREEA